MQAAVQPITGVVPPDVAESRSRDVWPSVARHGGLAGLGRALTATIFLAPLAWLIMSLAYFGKLLPFAMLRYSLSNRRIMIRRGWRGSVSAEVNLKDIDDVKLITDSNSSFFRSGDLQIVRNGQVAMTLSGVPEPDSFRLQILNMRNAWYPERAKSLGFIAASAVK